MELITITNGSDKTWKFPRKYLQETSRFYQDLCKETNSEPIELVLPNLLSGFEPSFQDLENLIICINSYKTIESIRDNRNAVISLLTARQKMGEMTTSQYNDLATLAKRLDMPTIIAELVLYEICDGRYSLALEQISDNFILNCLFECKGPLESIFCMIKSGDPKFLSFVINNKDRIIQAEKKYSGKKELFMLEIYHQGSYSISVLPKGKLMPCNNNSKTFAKYAHTPIDLPLTNEDFHLCRLISTKLQDAGNILKFHFEDNTFSMGAFNVFKNEWITLITSIKIGQDVVQDLASSIPPNVRDYITPILYLPFDSTICHIVIQNKQVTHF